MADEARSPRIDGERLRSLFDGLNRFGRSASTGGYSRPAFSDEDMEARRWIAGQMDDAGLDVSRDAAGTIVGRWETGSGPAVMIGSHLDTVAEGGAFAGTVGVCVALESVRAMREAGVAPSCPIEVVATSDQEGRFGFSLGSEAMTGRLDGARAAAARDAGGAALADAMADHGLDAGALGEAARRSGSLKAFLELHVEQGPELEGEGAAVGVVETVSGLWRWRVTLTGRGGHAGLMPAGGKGDALAGFAEIAATIPSVIRIVGRDETRVHVGNLLVEQKSPQMVATRAAFDVVIRDTDEKRVKTIGAALRSLIERTSRVRGLEVAIDVAEQAGPVALDAELAATVEAQAKRLGLDSRRMTVGIGRDVGVMQDLCPAALILIPSRDGIGFSPDEWTDWSAIENGARLFLATLLRLADVPDDAEEGAPAAAAEEDVAAADDKEPASAEPADAATEAAGEPAGSREERAKEVGEDHDFDFEFDLDLDDFPPEKT
ncbi:MAG: Zn-dependent hydrolase [Pararhizobium sp.]